MKVNRPPALFHRFFRWYCSPKLIDYVEGDLMEMYERRLKTSGKRKADIHFMIDVLLLFRPKIIKPAIGYQRLNTYGMYKSYFRILVDIRGFFVRSYSTYRVDSQFSGCKSCNDESGEEFEIGINR